MGSPGDRTVRVTLVGRTGCHLCDLARESVAAVTGELGVDFEEIDIDAHPALLARWADKIPVTLVDGVEHDHWWVDPGRLRAALQA